MNHRRHLLGLLCLSLPLSLAACQTAPEEDEGDLESTEQLPQALVSRPDTINHASEQQLNANEGLVGDTQWNVGDRRTRLTSSFGLAGHFTLSMKGDDCALVLTQTTFDASRPTTRQLWTSKSVGSAWRGKARNCYAWFQTDGNFVIYGEVGNQPIGERATYQAVWASGTHRHPGAHLQLQNDGNVAIRATNGRIVWETRTTQKVPTVTPVDGTNPGGNHPGCTFSRTETKCGFPPSWPVGSMICRDIYTCTNHPHPREESDPWRVCGVCGRG